MPRGIFIFSSFCSSFFHHFGLRLLHHFLGISEIRRIRSKNRKNDEKMKKKMKISGGVPWPEPSAGVFGNASRNLHFFIILAIIFSSFWPSFGPSFLGSSEICREFQMMKKRRLLPRMMKPMKNK